MPGLHERRLDRANAVDDLVLLNDSKINERGIVENLGNRYGTDDIYTYIGPVLLSVNPFKKINNLYSTALMREFYGKFKFEGAPHVFASAEDAHRKLMATGVDQCVLISGESGAGKTEAAKQVMQYVSTVSSNESEYAVAQDHQKNRHSKIERTVGEIKDSLLKSNPVLEAFGNAKTIRNDNSSRFGKYMEIQMDYNGTPLGGRITNYLLEKPRVVHQAKGERNFHIFYLLTEGMPKNNPLYSELSLQPATQFGLLCDPASNNVKTVNDREWFEEMDEAMATVGIDGRSKKEFYKMIAAVLWLGNIQFKKKASGQDACEVTTMQELNLTADMLSVPPKALQEALTFRSRETSIDKLKSPLVKVDECNKVRDALAKALYARMFQKLVGMINKTIFTPVSELALGVLDIYGFEIFEQNSFEQLCINYCNEKLQQYFIQLTLKAEQEEYNREGIPWKEIDYFNNKIVCDLIEGKKPPGIIAYLDEQITLNREEDLGFLNKMKQQIKNKRFRMPEAKGSSPTEFIVEHYAGEVKYSAKGMIDKNKDTLFRDLLVLTGKTSTSAFISEMFPEGVEKHNFKKPITAGSQFVTDMNQLITNLEKSEPHYIRCIKPNDNKRASDYNTERVSHQVKYLGLLENVKVRRAGYAFRRKYDLFVRRYKMLSPETWPKPQNHDDIQNTQLILAAVGIGTDRFAKGKTKIFIEKPEDLFTLERARKEKMVDIVKIVQRAFRRWKLRLQFQKLREIAVNLLQSKKRRNNSWVLFYLGDYVHAAQDERIMTVLNGAQLGNVIYADESNVHILGKKPTIVTQVVVMTPRSFVFFTKMGRKSTKDIHTIVPFDQIEQVVLSTFADDFIIVNIKPKVQGNKTIDSPSLVFESVHKSEIVTLFSQHYKTSYNIEAPLHFIDNLQVVVTMKGGLLGKSKQVRQGFEWQEDGAIMGRAAKFMPILLSKKSPNYNPTAHRVVVGPMLGSKAPLQINAPLPERVLAHTAVGRQGKKKYRNRRRQY